MSTTTAGFTLSPDARTLILEHEVGGADTYKRLYQRPEWPGDASGVTVGIGYDCGYNTAAQIKADWLLRIPDAMVDALVSVSGLKGSAARSALSRVRAVVSIPLDAALAVFEKRTVPRYWQQTLQAFPGAEKLPADCQGALLSLVFNRGPLVDGSKRRREMLEIRQAIAAGEPERVPGLLLKMIRVWEGSSIYNGMKRRRTDEANLFAAGLKKSVVVPAASPVRVILKGQEVAASNVYRDPHTGSVFVWARSVTGPFGWTLTAVERTADKGAGLAVYQKADGPDADTQPDEFDLNLLFVPGQDGEGARGFVLLRETAKVAGYEPHFDSEAQTVTVG